MLLSVLLQLYLRRFKKIKYNTPLIGLAGILLCKLIVYLLKGTWDAVFFNWITQSIFSDGTTMSIENIVLIGIPSIGIVGILAWIYYDIRKEYNSDYLSNTLIEMHKRMLNIVSDRIKQNKDIKWMEDAIPELAHKWGLVDIGDWNKFKSNMLARIKRRIPKTDVRNKSKWFKAVSAASHIAQELIGSKEWTEDDVMAIGKWLDLQGKGLFELRGSDRKWNTLDKSIEPYRADSILRRLIKKHKDYSYAYCSVSLAQSYTNVQRSEPISRMLLNVLVGMPISKEEMNADLYKVLDDIRKRQKIQQGQEKASARVKV